MNGAMAIFLAMGTLGYSTGPIVSSAITQFVGLNKMSIMSVLGIFWAFYMFKIVPKISVLNDGKPKIHFKKAFKEILSNRKLNILNIKFIIILRTE